MRFTTLPLPFSSLCLIFYYCSANVGPMLVIKSVICFHPSICPKDCFPQNVLSNQEAYSTSIIFPWVLVFLATTTNPMDGRKDIEDP